MKNPNTIILLAAALVAILATSQATAAVNEDRPNVVIIYGDDVGYGDVGAYGSTMIPTPNIDRLASQGLRFTDGHCSAATCTPSRFSMLTGIHGFREGVAVLPPNAPMSIPTDALTLPKLFKKAGYHTGVVGKWHLGIGDGVTPVDWNGLVKPGPLEVGFDTCFLLPSTNDRVPCVFLRDHRVIDLDPNDPLFVDPRRPPNQPGSTAYPDGKKDREAMTYYQSSHGHDNSIINGIGRIGYMAGGKSALWNDETMSDDFLREAKQYIGEHKDEPFFLYFASQEIHVPRAPHPRFQGKTELGYRGDAMVEFDWATGQILDTLEEHGLTDNTIVIFSSDNGPVYDDGYDDGTTIHTSLGESENGHDGSGIYRGGKYQIYEGGTRVPLIIRWPNRIKPGTTSDALVNQIDFIASFADLLDIELPEGEARDSRNTLAALLGQDPVGLEFMIEESFVLALRYGDWKYTRTGKPKWPQGAPKVELQLFNLKDDPGETTNLIGKHPEIAALMAKRLDAMEAAEGVRSN